MKNPNPASLLAKSRWDKLDSEQRKAATLPGRTARAANHAKKMAKSAKKPRKSV
jgi:hypothetical protein